MAEPKEKQHVEYTEDSIRSLDWREHIRLRPGMYIGKLGDGSAFDDGIYVLIKEVMDNCIDEHTMGYGKHVDLEIEGKTVTIRDYGRGIPLGKVVDVVSKINTGAKYDSKAFQKSVGLNGVGTKAVNALSQYFKVQSVRDGKMKVAEFEKGASARSTAALSAAGPALSGTSALRASRCGTASSPRSFADVGPGRAKREPGMTSIAMTKRRTRSPA